jgi:hypothetical protein
VNGSEAVRARAERFAKSWSDAKVRLHA